MSTHVYTHVYTRLYTETDYDAIVNDTVAALNMQQSKCQDLKVH